MTTQRQALEAALSALESERSMAADDQGNYTVEVTPKRILAAIEKVKAAADIKPKYYSAETVSEGGWADFVSPSKGGHSSSNSLISPAV